MRRTELACMLALAGGLLLPCSRAEQWKVDLDGSSNGSTASGYLSWYSAAGSGVVSRTFTNSASGSTLACSLSQTYPPPSATLYLKFSWLNKNGQGKYNLAFDGVWAHQKDDAQVIDRPYTNGGALCLTLSNLPAGPHTITTYHNDVWGTGTNTSWINTNAYTMSRCVISVGGVPVATNTPSFQVTNDTACGFAFFTVNAVEGQPVVVNFDPDHSGPLDFVVLNGFEVDRPSSPGFSAVSPVPANGDEHVFASNDNPAPGSEGNGLTTLLWVPSQYALSNDVYFGTSSNAVFSATTGSPEFKGRLTTNVWVAAGLDSRLSYYWRVDEVNASQGVTNLSQGEVWRFRTRHLAFPGAEGYGRFARGGRGGRVIEVTNLLDYLPGSEPVIPGSYRAAIEANGARTIVFRASGLIRLKAPCTINSANGFVTVAGQTAPGEGICLSQYRAGLSACSDVVMRFVRCRIGDFCQDAMDGMGLGNSTHSIIDHCSISWTIDEGTSSRQSGGVNSGSAMITFQRNIISEPLQHSYHYLASDRNYYEPHAFAGSISGEIGSYHHNLIAHSTDRNWSLAGGLDASSHYAGSLDIRNNVVYNWLGRTTDGGVARCNYVSNYYKPYPANPYATWLLKLDALNPAWGTEQYYMVGNVMEGRSYESDNWMSGSFYNGATVMNQVRTNQEIFPSFVMTHTARDAFKNVLSDVGANRPAPDIIDRRIVQEARDGTWHYKGTNGPTYTINGVLQPDPSPNYPGIIDSQTDVRDAANSPNFPWPAYTTYGVPVDSDHDGLPDWWEALHNTNPKSTPANFSDSNADPDGDGYSNLEDYLNWLAAPHFECPQDGHIDIDLAQFTRGFTASPQFVVSSPSTGSVSAIGAGATFLPAPGFHGLGAFNFTVSDAQGSTISGRIGVHVVRLPRLSITLSNGVPGMQFEGELGLNHDICISEDLANWTSWFSVLGAGTAQPLPLPPGGSSGRLFFRAVYVP